MADTGLLLSHSFDEKRLQAEEIHRRILCQSIELNQGMFLENLVAQMLVASGHPLYFFSKTREKSRAEEMEIDFLIAKSKLSQRHNISPLEVKSGKRTKLASLNKFRTKYQDYVSQPIVLHTGDWKIQDGITYLPVYLTPFL